MNNIHFIKTNKFKTNTIGIMLRARLSKKTATKNALLLNVLKSSSRRYPSPRSIAAKCGELYGAVIDGYIIKKGAEQTLFFYGEAVKSEGDGIFIGVIDMLKELIFNPAIENGSFPEDIVKREAASLKAKILALNDDKRGLAAELCIREMFSDCSLGVAANGYAEDVDLINGRSLYEHYRSLMEECAIDVCFTGEEITTGLMSALQPFRRFHRPFPHTAAHIPEKARTIIREDDASQGRLCAGMIIKPANKQEEVYSLLALNELLGAGPSSRLFAEAREKEGLCYYISSSLNTFSLSLIIEAGIRPESLEKTMEIINSAVKSLTERPPEPDELENAKRSLVQHFISIADSQTAIMNFYMNEIFRGTNNTIEDVCSIINSLNDRHIMRAAENITPSVVYFICKNKKEAMQPCTV